MSRLANAVGMRNYFSYSDSLTACTSVVRAILGLTAGPDFSHYENRFFKLDVRIDSAA